MIRAIALRFGYVESNCLDWLVFQAEFPEEQTREKAFYSLTEYLYLKYMQKKPRNKACCQMTLSALPNGIFCALCGNRLKDVSFGYYDWLAFLEEIRTNTIDGAAGLMNYYPNDEDNPEGWDPALFVFGIPNNEMIIVSENAAEMLSWAVGTLHPETQAEMENEINDAFFEDYTQLLAEAE